MTYTETQERSKKRLRNSYELAPSLKKLKAINSPPPKPELIEPLPEITFNQNKQSVLSITNLKEPLKLQLEYPIPEINEYEILVSNKAIGLNPIDWKGHKYGFIKLIPRIDGRESSGICVKRGSKVENFKINDKVIISSTSYRDCRTSTFQQFTAIDSRLCWKLPNNFSFEDGATIGVGLVTAGIIIYNSFKFDLKLNPPIHKNNQKTLLIWGGSTIVGIYLTQLGKIHGLKIISIANIKYKNYLKSIGVDYVVDRFKSNNDIKNEIETISPNGIEFAVDCISKETSQNIINIIDEINRETTNENKTKFSSIVGIPKEIPNSIELKEVIIKKFHEDKEFGSKFIEITTHYLNNFKIKPTRYKQYKGGLEKITDALKDLEKIGANGEKYVVTV
ncbi:uncharacterized protein KGF55_004238 [Candida pseudojiufengensis]|uniref:uncharacterized protein n=1 Tax=Candida pseudojiufengensis TaxID=497109 RepID=UPI0022240289|nr:uncharacterized protein KGF55_004238 [Candida pseudojiufengensis]KAI5960971.1 hypothetical protein KGF55_004238 [Candida pseudojiufengensis]